MTIDKAQAQTLVTDSVSSFCLNNDKYGHDDTTITITATKEVKKSKKKKKKKEGKKRKRSSSSNNNKKKKKKNREKVPTTLSTTEERKATGQATALEILEQMVCDAVVERVAESVTNADNDGTSLQKQEEKHSSSSKKKNKKPLTTAERRAKSSGGVVEGSKKDKLVVAAALPVVATIVAVADADDSVDVDNERRTLIPKPQFRRKKKGTPIVMPSSRKEIERQVSNSGMLENVPHQKSDAVAEIVQEIMEMEFHPEIESKYSSYDNDPPSGTPRQQLRQLFLQFTEKEMKEFEDYVMTIVPLNNNARYNHQSKQALRKFFGKDGKLIDKDTIERCIYGPKAVLNTTGLHPKDYRVYPFSSELIEITKLLTKIVKEELGPAYDDFEFDFNFMEIKMYLGKDMFQDANGNPIQDNGGDSIRVDNNQSVGPHNDLVFDDNGKQDSKDTARGDHPISTFTLGSTRKLIIRWFKKGKSKKSKWKKIKSSRRVTELEDGSIFILVPSDEIPQEFHDFLYKTKHEGKFTHKSASGVSFGFVFRSVKSTSFFDIKTNCWKWDKDKNYKELVTKMLNEGERCKKHAAFPESNPKTSKDVKAVKNNIVNFVTKC